MKKLNATLFVFVLMVTSAFAQINVTHFNAGWNEVNGVSWVMDLKDCKTIGLIDIATDTEAQIKHKIAVVPTIIIFKDGEEVARWSLFKDKNEINEKNVVGFASFVVMCLFAVADLLTSILADKDLIINEVVYNSFVWVTLGCFGISSFEKVKKK